MHPQHPSDQSPQQHADVRDEGRSRRRVDSTNLGAKGKLAVLTFAIALAVVANSVLRGHGKPLAGA